jgi:dienelactone hydrolase
MATVLLFHHARGQTPAFFAFADELRRAGHTVHTPDLFEGRTFPTIEEGVAHAEKVGFEEIMRRGAKAAEGLPTDLVYAGFSLGVLSAQKLAQTRAGARGALLYYSCVPVAMLSPAWPAGVPVEIHIKEEDKWAEEDLVAARDLVRDVPAAELFVYPGSGHYFAEAGFADYDEAAAELLMERTLEFLRRVG